MTSLNIILIAAASTGFIHTIFGPDHYLPFIVLSKARKWSLKKTLFTTFYCGLGHLLSSIIIGFVGIGLGYGISQIESLESARGDLAGWAFFFFGLVYMIWGIIKAVKNKPHSHLFHSHGGGEMHAHKHDDHEHGHSKSAQMLTPWVLFIIFVLGPCEILVPLVMIPAASHNTEGIIAVALMFSTVTILTMFASVTIGYYGLKALPTAQIDRYMHAIAGATICLSAAAILFLGL